MPSSSQDRGQSKLNRPKFSMPRLFKARKPSERKPSVDTSHSAAALDQISRANLFDTTNSHPATPHTANAPSSRSNNPTLSALKQVLPTLSAISRSASLPGLDVVFDSLLAVITKVETMLENLEGFGYLVTRLETLQFTLSRFNGAGKASADLDQLVDPLRKELESLHNDIDKAGSRGGLERFIVSKEDASSLASHNLKLDRIILQLTLDVATSTSHGIDEVLRGVVRVEHVLSSRGESAAGGMTQMFRGAKINTVGSGNGTGGHVGSGNVGMHFQDYGQADVVSSGTVGSSNISQGAVEMAMHLKLQGMKSAILV